MMHLHLHLHALHMMPLRGTFTRWQCPIIIDRTAHLPLVTPAKALGSGLFSTLAGMLGIGEEAAFLEAKACDAVLLADAAGT